MMLQIDFVWLVGLLISFLGAAAGVGKLLLHQFQKHIDTRFKHQDERLDAIVADSKQEVEQWRRIEKDFMLFRAELPEKYVRREDYIRGQSVLETKIDSLAVKIENMQLRGVRND